MHVEDTENNTALYGIANVPSDVNAYMKSKRTNWVRRLRVLDIIVLIVMCFLLYRGVSWQIFETYTDAARYECYAVAFWEGVSVLQRFPDQQCDFITRPDPSVASPSHARIINAMQHFNLPSPLIHFVATQSDSAPLHALPHEYPALAIIPFSLGLLGTHHLYQVDFALWMALIAAVIYLVLVFFKSRRAALACAIYLVTGCWGTAAGRFDLMPSALTLIAIICAMSKRWNWAFVTLALAVMFKLYPFVLLPPFLIAQQLSSRDARFSWRRFIPVFLFIAVCVVISVASLFLSVEGTLAPLTYFRNRPFQIESSWSSLLWLLSHFGYPLTFTYTYGSLNVFSRLASMIAPLSTILPIGALLYTYWLQWRGKVSLPAVCLLTLLIVIVTGKVFSPQYLIWVAPLVAYVGEFDFKWLLSWTAIGLLTTLIYPYIYNMVTDLMQAPYIAPFFPVTALRNLLLLGFIVALLVHYARAPRDVTP